MRILADLPEDDVHALDALADRNNRSRAAEIREAIELYLRLRSDRSWIRRGHGYWHGRAEIDEGPAYQHAVREDRGEL